MPTPTRKVRVIASRAYYRTTSIVIDVPVGVDPKEFMATNTPTGDKVENAICAATLNGGEDEYQFIEDPLI